MWLGIDFGTCNSSAALVVNNNLESIADSKKNSYLFPSSVYAGEKETIFVALQADREGKKDPNRYCRRFKQKLKQNGSYQLGDKKYLTEELITYLFTKLKEEADNFLTKINNDDSISSAAIAVPATCGDTERKLIEKAALDAGFTEVALKEESVAAAIYWESRNQLEQSEILLVYDLGGSSFKANLIEKQEGGYKILGQSIELENCAGIEFDRLIYQDLQQSSREVLAELLDFQNKDIQASRARLILIDWCEEIKKQLKERTEIEELIPGSFSDFYHLSRSKFNQIIEPYIRKTISSCQKLIQDTLNSSQKIKGVLLVGGSCQIPWVREIIAKQLQLPILLDSEPELAVCQGMALYGSSLDAKKKAESYLSQGIARFAAREQESAISCLDMALKINPELTRAYYSRGLILYTLGKTKANLEQAVENFDRALSLSPDWQLAFLSRAVTKMSLEDYIGAMGDFYRAGLILDVDAAESELEKIIKALPDFPDRTIENFEFELITVNVEGVEIKRDRLNNNFFSENLGNGAVIEMVAIPGGTFTMGSPVTEGYNWERPEHEVTVKPFFMSKFVITQKIWQVIAALPKISRDLPINLAKFKGDDRPIDSITWEDANEFCARLSKKTGLEYRLPSEAEWEYACRAGTKTPFHFGKTINSNLANYDGNYTYAAEAEGEARGQTTKVGSFPPNAFGLYDMHGNVWEWCSDSWHDNYNSAPSDGSIWLANDKDFPHLPLLRGGSWNNSPDNCRSASRLLFSPECNLDRCGFRIVCTVTNNLSVEK